MFSSKKPEENKELNSCTNRASLFKQIAFEKCRKTPASYEFNLNPIHWEKSSFQGAILREGYAGVPASGVYSAKGSGSMFKPLHSEEECRNASLDVINELKKCISLAPDSTLKPKP